MSLVQPLPLSWLIHEVTYEASLEGRDRFGNPIYDTPILIGKVRYDEQTAYTRDVTENSIAYNGIVFVDFVNSVNVPEVFVENSKLLFKGKELTISKVVTCYQPESDVIRHWELEVV